MLNPVSFLSVPDEIHICEPKTRSWKNQLRYSLMASFQKNHSLFF